MKYNGDIYFMNLCDICFDFACRLWPELTMKLCNEFKACTIELCTQLHEIDRTIKSYQNSDNFTPVFFLVVATYIYVCIQYTWAVEVAGYNHGYPICWVKKNNGNWDLDAFRCGEPCFRWFGREGLKKLDSRGGCRCNMIGDRMG